MCYLLALLLILRGGNRAPPLSICFRRLCACTNLLRFSGSDNQYCTSLKFLGAWHFINLTHFCRHLMDIYYVVFKFSMNNAKRRWNEVDTVNGETE